MYRAAAATYFLKDCDFLLCSVFLNDKIIFAQARNVGILLVVNHGGNQHQLGLRGEGLAVCFGRGF